MHLRQGHSLEAALLSDLALRSKGYWGYDPAFIEACRKELTIDPNDMESRRVTVAVEGSGPPVGLYTLEGSPPEGEVGMLFVEPDQIGTGVGRLLWDHMTSRASSLGFRSLRIEADPGAVTFYQKMGCIVVGSAPSGSIPGRHLPLLVLDLTPTSNPAWQGVGVVGQTSASPPAAEHANSCSGEGH